MKDSKIIYINLQQAIELHTWIVDSAGGNKQIENSDRLNNILNEIKNDNNYPEFKDKLTQLIFTINTSKQDILDSQRLSLALSCYFLELNGYDYVVHYFAEEMENIVLWVEKGKIDKKLLAEIINSLINAEDYSEELKLKIAIAVNR